MLTSTAASWARDELAPVALRATNTCKNESSLPTLHLTSWWCSTLPHLVSPMDIRFRDMHKERELHCRRMRSLGLLAAALIRAIAAVCTRCVLCERFLFQGICGECALTAQLGYSTEKYLVWKIFVFGPSCSPIVPGFHQEHDPCHGYFRPPISEKLQGSLSVSSTPIFATKILI